MSIKDKLSTCIVNNDLLSLRGYLNDKKITKNMIVNELMIMEPFNPSYDMLDFIMDLLGKNEYASINNIVYKLGINSKFEMFEYFLIKIKNIELLLATILRLYSNEYMIDASKIICIKMLYIITDTFKDTLTLNNIIHILNNKRQVMDIKKYIRNDFLLYVVYNILSQRVLESVSSDVIERLVLMSIKNNNNTSDILTNTLLAYIPNSNLNLRLEEVRVNVKKKTRPSNYISLFEEDV